MASTLSIPGVYVRRVSRPRRPRRVRTDVAGFIGFEPRVWPLPVVMSGPPDRHHVAVRVGSVEIEIDERRTVLDVPANGELVLATGAGHPVQPGEALAYTVVAFLPTGASPDRPRRSSLTVLTGAVTDGVPSEPADDGVAAAVELMSPGAAWRRLAAVQLRRDVTGRPWLTVCPRTGPIVCEDWPDYLAKTVPSPDGTRLAVAVRAFFANGGDRCHIAPVRRPEFTDLHELARARMEMAGSGVTGPQSAGAAATATGWPQLALVEEVAVVAVPDIHARRPAVEALDVALPPSEADDDFRPCGPDQPGALTVPGQREFDEPLYDLDDIYETQRTLLLSVAGLSCPPQLIVTPPAHRDAATGTYEPPNASDTLAWVERFLQDPGLDDRVRAFAAMYWPWVVTQASVGAAVEAEPTDGFVAGVVARRDLASGPHVAPANERVEGIVGVAGHVDDTTFTNLYDPAGASPSRHGGAVNPVRAIPGRGLLVQGSRTLSADPWQQYLPIRRGLSAIERQACVALREVVFEPNTPLLWLRITNLLVNLLLGLFDAGALRGAQPEEAFSVRCDETLNPPDAVANGRVVCEVRVALAAPAEFLVFRLAARSEIQSLEVTENPWL